MSTTMGLLGIFISLAFMTFAVYKNWSILYCSVISVILIAVTNGLNITEVITTNYTKGLGGFAAPYFILFMEGAMIGKLFDDSGAAWRVGSFVANKLGTKWSILGYIVVTAILEYGGISTFVICFVLLPIARPIFKKTNTPWYLWPAITLIGILPSELMIPGGLQIHNILPTSILGTDLMAAPLMSLCITLVFFIYSYLYIKMELKSAEKVEWKRNSVPPVVEEGNIRELEERAPNLIMSLVPILICLISINVFKFKPISGLGIGIVVAVILFFRSIKNIVNTLNIGAKNGIEPLILVAAVVGIAEVVTVTPSFNVIKEAMLSFSSSSSLATGLSVVGITNVISLICGSASGSITMICKMFAPSWLEMGLPPEWIHRFMECQFGMDIVDLNC